MCVPLRTQKCGVVIISLFAACITFVRTMNLNMINKEETF